jgi:IclR family KDG regulon transcriptional repressor
MTQRVQSIERGIDALMALVHGPRTLTEVSREAGLSKGTCSRILASLGYQNLVVRTETNAYMLGPGSLRLINGVMGGLGTIVGLGRQAYEELREYTGETIAVHVRVGTDRVCVEELPSTAAVRYMSSVGSSAPLYVGSAGRVLLAFADDDDLERMLAVISSADGNVDIAWLRTELETIRAQGYAVSVGERVHGASAISVPVRGQDDFTAALSILGPDFRLTVEKRLEFLPALCKAAEIIAAVHAETGRSMRAGANGAPNDG